MNAGQHELCYLNPALIRIDGDTQSRESTDGAWVKEIADRMREGVVFPSVIVFCEEDPGGDGDKDIYWCADGHHRVAAALLAEFDEIDAIVYQGNQEDAALFGCGANKDHGLKRSPDDKRKAIKRCLKLRPQWTNRRVAEHVGVSDKTVADERRELEAGAEIPHVEVREGRDGKVYPTKPAEPASPPSAGDRPEDPRPPAPSPELGTGEGSTDISAPPIKLPPLEVRLALTMDALLLLDGATGLVDLRAKAFPDGIDEDAWRKTIAEGKKRDLWGHEGKIDYGRLIGPIWRKVKGSALPPDPPPGVGIGVGHNLSPELDADDPAMQGHLARQEDDDCDDEADPDTDTDGDGADDDRAQQDAVLLLHAIEATEAQLGAKSGAFVSADKAWDNWLDLLGEADAPGNNGVLNGRWEAALEAGGGKLFRSEREELARILTETGAVSKRPNYDSDAWGTPADILEDVREVLGGIDLDPASNEAAQKTVQATRFYTKADDGLTQPWSGRVWLNPPFSHPLVEQFVNKLVAEYDEDNVTAAVLVVNNATETKWFQRLLRRFIVCFPEGRTAFVYGDGAQVGARQGQALFYLGPDRERFREVFGKRGTILEAT